MTLSGARDSTDDAAARHGYSLVPIPPRCYEKYTLIGKLGHGGMAEVNLALIEGKGGFRKLTVVKRLHPHLAEVHDFVDMFLDEARLAARLNHPHVVQTYEVGDHEGNPFLAMEYLDGQGLERLLRISGQRQEWIPYEVASRIVADALDGLAYAHELTDFDGSPLGVVHRDVSPQNIFITYGGMVKLLDFGIAKAATHVVETKTGVIKGKYAYIAPEQALGQEVDQRSDIWSMGVVLWEVLTGRRLFKSINELATLHETLQGEIKLPSACRPDLPTELDTICMRALQRDPEERYPTAQDMKEDLERYLVSLPESPRRKDVSRLMKERFASVLENHEQTLAECLDGTGSVSDKSVERLVPSLTPSVSGVHVAGTPTPTPTPGATATPPGVAEAPGDRKRRVGWKLAVGGAVVLVALLTSVVVLSRNSVEPAPGTSTGALTARVDPGGSRAAPPTPPGESDEGRDLAAPEEASLERAEAVEASLERAEAVEASLERAEAVEASLETSEEAGLEDNSVGSEEAGSDLRSEPSTRERRLAALRRQRREDRREARRESREDPSPPAPVAEAPGFLTLATTPWTRVSLGGRPLGTTPLVRAQLPAGSHTLRLSNPEEGIDQTYRVTIRAGETLTRRIGLR